MSDCSTAPPTMETEPRAAKRKRSARPPATVEKHAVALFRMRIIRSLHANTDIVAFSQLLHDYTDLVRAEMAVEQQFYTVADLCARYSMTRKTAERLPIPRHKIGGLVRFSRPDVLEYETQTRKEIDDHGDCS